MNVVGGIQAGDAMLGAPGNGPEEEALSTTVLDEAVFNELHESLSAQPEALLAVYRKFLQNAATLIDALADQDTTARISTVHTLKGSAAMLGADRLASLAARLQDQLARPHAPAMDEAARQLRFELAEFRQRIHSRFASIGHPAL